MQLRRRLPSASALFTFEAAARLGGFSRAALELNITQPAVSHAISRLERHIGQPLFIRAGPRLELTSSGERLSRVTTRAFMAIDDALEEIQTRDDNRQVVMLSISSGMATHWLMPRYGAFLDRFPDTDLQFQLIPGAVGGPLHNCDLGLRVAAGESSRRLDGHFASERVVAVATADYLDRHGPLDRPKQPHTLINLSDHWFGWTEFASATGISVPPHSHRIAFSDYSVVVQAALSGQGVALAWTSVASRLILDGLLKKACDAVMVTDRNYHFVTSSQRPARQIVHDVRDWLITQMRAEEKELDLIL